MTFKQLEHVLEIYKAGSVRRAAEQCYITQPALSQQLHRLEQELGFALFDHTASPLRPTAAGEAWFSTSSSSMSRSSSGCGNGQKRRQVGSFWV